MGKRAKRRDDDLEFLNKALILNAKVQQEGPKRKTWTGHDLKTISPLTPTQEDMFHAWFEGKNICAHGSAGTGKTFLALYLAMTAVIERREQNRIILVRSAVPTRDIGFLPGTLEEKTALYELPYHDICWELIGRPSTYDDMKAAGTIEFMTTSFVRGLTWDNAVVIIDEAQNMTFHEMNSIMTRLGQNTKIIVNGDLCQTDLDGKKGNTTGMQQFIRVIKNMREFALVEFNTHDIVRSELVKSWIMATENTK